MPPSDDPVLYHLPGCPYCQKVRAGLARLGVELPLRDVGADAAAARELVRDGGEDQVPCLRIPHPDGRVEWLYESDDILAWLGRRYRG